MIGCVVLGFALLIAGSGFFIRDLSADQRIVLCWACSLAAGFAAGSFAGSAYLSYQINSSTLGNVLIVTTSGFAVWLITFYFLYQTIGPRPSTTSVHLLDALTNEIIERDFTVSFHEKQSPKVRVEECVGAESSLHSWPADEIAIDRVDCRGYEFSTQSVVNQNSLQVIMSRSHRFPYIIQPKLNAAIDSESFRLADLPKLSEVKVAVGSEETCEQPEDVVFTCENATDRHVDVLLWHYPPVKEQDAGLSFPVQQINGCPIPPGKQGSFSEFALTPGYFLVFVSWHGREAMLVGHGNLYKSKTPKLTLQTFGDDDRAVKGYLSF